MGRFYDDIKCEDCKHLDDCETLSRLNGSPEPSELKKEGNFCLGATPEVGTCRLYTQHRWITIRGRKYILCCKCNIYIWGYKPESPIDILQNVGFIPKNDGGKNE